jgi:hypothetical protein
MLANLLTLVDHLSSMPRKHYIKVSDDSIVVRKRCRQRTLVKALLLVLMQDKVCYKWQAMVKIEKQHWHVDRFCRNREAHIERLKCCNVQKIVYIGDYDARRGRKPLVVVVVVVVTVTNSLFVRPFPFGVTKL